jgi:uncharacterized membrane protein
MIQLALMALTLIILDAVWLTSQMADTMSIFAKLQGQPLVIRPVPAGLVYILILGAVWFFTHDAKTIEEAVARGSMLGLAMYGVYDLTNYATLAKYPLSFAITDMAWGTFLCACVSTIGFLCK